MSLKVATLQKHRHTAGGCSSASTLCGRGIHRFGATIPLLKPIAASMIKEAATGVEFPLVEKLWVGDEMRCMGASNRVKKIAFVGVKLYAIALSVEAQLAAKELGVRDRGNFFETDDDYCCALVDGALIKSLELVLVRNIQGKQFIDAIDDSLRPRLALSGDLGSLEKLQNFFVNLSLSKGTVIKMAFSQDSKVDICVRESRPPTFENEIPDLCIESPSLSRALLELYLGSESIIPKAKKEWADGAKSLLESEKIRRDTRPGGSG
ncbi:Fatty-acid-binding protein 3 [Picochlorum sp. SENEW3]|nr:Fatty-acid-binding protein 3 [Picochlorum sp. SENEW3]WPT15661.1 Fatty-acid-binding protein 3 [Picochlorum sp. SENEW3]